MGDVFDDLMSSLHLGSLLELGFPAVSEAALLIVCDLTNLSSESENTGAQNMPSSMSMRYSVSNPVRAINILPQSDLQCHRPAS